ncbi:hypothetical protein B0T13DRAFT_443489 [Neurospora crassa]|nr:hypothetical protein B0T13DRAFT_443489 [Neurospora crassa]
MLKKQSTAFPPKTTHPCTSTSYAPLPTDSGIIENDNWIDFFDFELYSQDHTVTMASCTTTTTNSPVLPVDNPTPATESAIGNTAYEPAPQPLLLLKQTGASKCARHLKFHMSRAKKSLVQERHGREEYTCSEWRAYRGIDEAVTP